MKGIIWAIAVPLFHGNDEHAHYASIQSYNIPEDYHGEEFSKTHDRYNLETHNISPELRAFLKATSFEKVRFKQENTPSFSDFSETGGKEQVIYGENKNFVRKTPAWTTNYPPLYYKIGHTIEKAFASENVAFRVLLIRFLSILAGVGVVVLSFLTFRELGFNQKRSFLASLLVSFQPMFTYITSIINVDSFLFLSFSLFLFGFVRAWNNKYNLQTLMLVFSGLIIGLLTKPTGKILLIYLLILIVCLALKKIRSRKIKIAAVVISLIPAIGLVIPFVNKILSFSKLSLETLPVFLNKYFSFYPLFKNSMLYWGNFGNLDAPIHKFALYGIWLIIAISTLGLIKLLYDWFVRKKKNGFTKKIPVALIFILMIILLHGGIMAFDWFYFSKTGSLVLGAPGRYFLPLIIARFYIIIIGFMYLFPEHLQFRALSALAMLMIILNSYSLFQIVIPRFYL